MDTSDRALPELPPALMDRLFATLYGDPERCTAVIEELRREHPEHAAALQAHLDHHVSLQRDPSRGADAEELTVPGYEVLGVLGEGGMGKVYRARQLEPLQRFVALKVIQRGLSSRRVVVRFEQERQALAAMDHDAIAKVFDCGTTAAGQPFIAMELVDGLPIHHYCDRHRLDLRERIELFVQVCQGVQHAHQKGVIHRDLKPGNVLVAAQEGRHAVKIIDFGVARAVEPGDHGDVTATEVGTIVGTRGYMSPEQAVGDARRIDTRSDVWSLGVILYELLVGEMPFQGSSAGGTPAEDTPPRPSTRLTSTAAEFAARRGIGVEALRRELQRDLDWVVLKTMAREPDRRYDTPAALAEDLRRYLAHQPLVAGPPSTAYRLRKLVRRHRVEAVAGVAVLLSLVVGGVGVSVQYVRAEERAAENAVLAQTNGALAAAESAAKLEAQERADEARQRADELEQVLAFQEAQWEQADVQTMGVHLRRTLLAEAADDRRAEVEAAIAGINFTDLALATLREGLLDRSAAAIATGFSEQPLVKSRLLHSLGGAFHELGLGEPARVAEAERLELLLAARGDADLDTASAMSSLAVILADLGNFTEAEPLIDRAVAVCRGARGEDDPETLSAVANRAGILLQQQRNEEADRCYADLVPRCRRVFGPEDPRTLAAIHDWGCAKLVCSDFAAAGTLLQEALDGRRRVLANDDPAVLMSLGQLATVLMKRGETGPALALLDESLEGLRRRYGDDHAVTLVTMHNHIAVLLQTGRAAEALTLGRQVLETRRRLLGPDHRDTVMSLVTLGIIADTMGNYAEGEATLRLALEHCLRLFGENDDGTGQVLNALSVGLTMQGKVGEAIELQRRAVDVAERLHKADSEEALSARRDLGGLLSRQGDLDEAERLLRDVHARSRKILGLANPDTLAAQQYLADVLIARGGEVALAEGEELQRDCLSKLAQNRGADNPEVLSATGRLASILEAAAKLDDALVLRQRVVDGMLATAGPNHPETWREQANLGALFVRLGREQEAIRELEAVLPKQRVNPGNDSESTQTIAYNLAVCYQRAERDADAEPLLRAALDWFRKNRGGAHATSLAVASHLGAVLERLGKRAEAQRLQRQVRDDMVRVLGATHPDTLRVRCTTALKSFTLGQTATAVREAKGLLDDYSRVIGEDDLDLQTLRANLGATLAEQGRTEEAEPLVRKALAWSTSHRGEGDPTTLAIADTMGVLLFNAGRVDEAAELRTRMLARCKEALGEADPLTLRATMNLGTVLNRKGRPAETIAMLEAAEGTARAVLVGDDVRFLICYLGVLGFAHTKRGLEADFAAGEKVLLDAHGLCEANPGPGLALKPTVVNALVALYEAWERAEPGRGHDRQVEEWKARAAGAGR